MKRRRRCHYCGTEPGRTRDHIVPKARGGPNALWNIVRACASCNAAKADSWPTCACEKCRSAVEKVTGMPWIASPGARARGNATDYFAKLMRDRGIE